MPEEQEKVQEQSVEEQEEKQEASPAEPVPQFDPEKFTKVLENQEKLVSLLAEERLRKEEPPPEDDLPEPDFIQKKRLEAYGEEIELPSLDPKKLAEYVEKIAEKKAQEKITSIASVYSQDRQGIAYQFAQINRQRAYEELDKIGLSDIKDEVEKLAKNYSPEQLTAPDAYETLAAIAIGKKMIEEKKRQASRPPSLASQAGQAAGSTSGFPMFTEEQLKEAQKYGLTENDLKKFATPNAIFTVEDIENE